MDRLLDHHPPSPIEVLETEALVKKGVRLLVKRDDLLRINEQSAFCGNKWRKLKYNLKEARRRELGTLLTFGGAFSNHLAAVAEAGQLFSNDWNCPRRSALTFKSNPAILSGLWNAITLFRSHHLSKKTRTGFY